MKVSAIVVTYNRIKKLKKCIIGLLNQRATLNNIIIINNASSDNTKKYLDNLKNYNMNKFIIKNLTENIGGSGGFSLGIKLAFEHTDSNYFWIMDDDTIPTQDSLKKLLISANNLHNNFGFLCSNIRLVNSKYPCNIPLPDKYWNIKLPSNLIRVDFATFVSYMISRKVVSEFGLPIRQMFIWGDDYEYSLRISNHKPCYFVSDSLVIHNSKESNKSVLQMPSSRDIYLKCSCRNSLYAVKKHKRLIDFIKKIFEEIYVILKVPFISKQTRLRKMYYMAYGLIQGVFFNPKIEFPKKCKLKHCKTDKK